MSDGDRIPIPTADPRLGRHINHDPRSRAYAVEPGEVPTTEVRHRRYGPKLNQGQLGSCTGNAGAHVLNCLPLRAAVKIVHRKCFTEDDAVRFYAAATALDPFPGQYPPQDTGSDALSICKAMRAEGLITGWETAFGFNHGLAVIGQYALMQGTYWTEAMFHPDADGRVHPTGRDVGGHEYAWVGVEPRGKHTYGENRSWFLNSWGSGWGKAGYFWMTWDDHAALLARDGDLTRPVP